jgi:transcriptional regulator with XRE-family HTH domain
MNYIKVLKYLYDLFIDQIVGLEMAKTDIRAYSKYAADAMQLMGKMIRFARKEQGMTVVELAGRAGVSRGLIQRIERGDPGCSLGAVFEVSAILGIPLFYADREELVRHNARMDDKLALLPERVRKPTEDIDDDF